jgi:hypothetical protein
MNERMTVTRRTLMNAAAAAGGSAMPSSSVSAGCSARSSPAGQGDMRSFSR